MHTAMEHELGSIRPLPLHVNVGDLERLASVGAGSGLLAYGLFKRSPWALGLSIVGGGLLFRGLTGHCQLYETLGIDENRPASRGDRLIPHEGLKCQASATIRRPAGDLFNYWRQLENLPKLIDHLESVTELDSKHSRWVAASPLGSAIHWDAEIITERPNEVIAWQSTAESELKTAGSIHFDESGDGASTTVRLLFKYNPPAGKVAAAVAEWFGRGANAELSEALERLKAIMETSSPAGAPR
ncbi:MAG TPA: YgaP-like transmembrane domain [Pirellulales bacterium]|jgi:uncharacterized membrane protein|nr:YgaP-like transmembrane domain [Pirellulales bacterium]